MGLALTPLGAITSATGAHWDKLADIPGGLTWAKVLCKSNQQWRDQLQAIYVQ